MEATANTSLELGLGLHCSHEVITRPSRQSCLSKIKPEMIRQVFNHRCFSNAEFCSPETPHEACEGFGSSPAFKMVELELFPQQTGFASPSIPNNSPNAFTEQEIMELDIQMGIPNSAKATSFQEEGIITLAACNSNRNSVERPLSSTRSTESALSSPASADVANESQRLQIIHSELPMAKKLSLQRFLQKRKDRIAVPYTTSSK